MDFSVLIIVKGRRRHLENVLAGIGSATIRPTEIIIAHMNEPAYPLAADVPLVQIELHDEHPLPLARARNLAAARATTGRLIFLDVDCIPEPDCFATLLHDLAPAELVMADPRYLSQPVEKLDTSQLRSVARQHPSRLQLPYGLSDIYDMFWSLGFAICAADFNRIGGFDESFVGYGGEDTDFAFAARRAGLRLLTSRAIVFHQDHKSYDPPLNWLEDIVSNAHAFKNKWGVWPMRGWLVTFADMGYVAFSEEDLRIIRLPDQAAVDAARKPSAV